MMKWHECCKETTRKTSGLRQLNSYAKEQSTCFPDINDTSEAEVRCIKGKKYMTEEQLIQLGRDLKATTERLFRNGQACMGDPDSKNKSEKELMPKRQEENIICYVCLQRGRGVILLLDVHLGIKTENQLRKRIHQKKNSLKM